MSNLSPATRSMLHASLIVAPAAFLALDCTYVAHGWWNGPSGAAHMLVAALYGLPALLLASYARGGLQTAMVLVAALGIVGNGGVGQDTVHVALGGNDLFQESGPATVFKMLGFFFPLTFALAAAALRKRMPWWWTVLMLAGAVAFPVAHVKNIGWLAIADGVVMLVALGAVFVRRAELA